MMEYHIRLIIIMGFCRLTVCENVQLTRSLNYVKSFICYVCFCVYVYMFLCSDECICGSLIYLMMNLNVCGYIYIDSLYIIRLPVVIL